MHPDARPDTPPDTHTALAHPKLARLFHLLRDGRHICLEDGDLYAALAEHTDAFTALFHALGYDLHTHRKGIYYFRGEATVTDTARRFALFTFILVETLGDAGRGVEEHLFTTTFPVDQLPHLRSERYRETMAELHVATPEDLVRLLKSMERFGFTEVQGDGDRVRFRRPMYRLLDLCTRVLDADEASE